MESLPFMQLRRILVFAMLVAIVLCTVFQFGITETQGGTESESSSSSSYESDTNGVPDDESQNSEFVGETGKPSQEVSFETYKQLFAQNRGTQLSGVKALLKFGNDQQRFSLVQVLLKQLFKTLGDAKHNLTIAGYLPGDPFPTNETTRNAFSKVLENTALFGDIALRLPDAVHSVYDREKEWRSLMDWSYAFCKESGVFEGTSQKLLHLMAQEINIIPKEPDFINPFKEAHKLEMESLNQRKVEKKPKKKIARGPRLRHTEL